MRLYVNVNFHGKSALHYCLIHGKTVNLDAQIKQMKLLGFQFIIFKIDPDLDACAVLKVGRPIQCQWVQRWLRAWREKVSRKKEIVKTFLYC